MFRAAFVCSILLVRAGRHSVDLIAGRSTALNPDAVGKRRPSVRAEYSLLTR